MSKEQKQALLDRGIQKLTSRKLLVWIVATGLMAWGGLESGDWVIISGLYLGGQSVIDAIVKLKGQNNMKLIMESWSKFLTEQVTIFTTSDTGHDTTIEFLGMKTDHDQTKIMLKLDGEQDVETYTASTIDMLADLVTSDLEANYDGYWFLENESYNEEYIKTFKANLVKALETVGANPKEHSADRGSYRDRDTGGQY